VNWAVWQRLLARTTRAEQQKYAELQRREEELQQRPCAFVDLVLDRPKTHACFDGQDQFAAAAREIMGDDVECSNQGGDPAADLVGEVDRFSAKFKDPLGKQSVARGVDPELSERQREAGAVRHWASVSGCIEDAR